MGNEPRLWRLFSPYFIEIISIGVLLGSLITFFSIGFFLMILLIPLALEEFHFLTFRKYFGWSDWGTGVVLTFPIFATATLMSFLFFQVVLSLNITDSIILGFALFTGISLLNKVRLKLTTKINLAANNHNIRFDLVSLIVILIAFMFYFIVFYRFTYISGPHVYLFGDDVLYLTNIISFTMKGQNLEYYAASILTPSSNFVYLSSANSLSAWLFTIFAAQRDPILFYICITALYGSLFSLTIMNTVFRNFGLYERLSLLFVTIGGFSLVGWLWLFSKGLNSIIFIPTAFAGTPFPGVNGLVIYLKGVTELILKGAWQGPGFAFFALSMYAIVEKEHKFGNKIKIFYIVSTLLAYIPLGLVLITGILWLQLLRFLRVKTLWQVIVISMFPAIFLRIIAIFVHPIYSAFLGVVIYPLSLNDTIAALVSIFLFMGSLVILADWKVFNSKVTPKFENSFLPISLLVLSGMMLLLFTTNLLPSVVTDDYLFGFAISISSFFVFAKGTILGEQVLMNEQRDNLWKEKNVPSPFHYKKGKKIVTILILVALIAPTIIYASEPTYYSIAGPQSIYLDSNDLNMTQWVRDIVPKGSVIIAPPNDYWIPALTDTQLLVTSLTPPTNNRLSFVNEFFGSVFYNFSSDNSLSGWYSLNQDGVAYITYNYTISSQKILEIVKGVYSQYTHNVSIDLNDLNLSFSVFPLSTVGTQSVSGPGISLLLSNGDFLEVSSSPNLTSSNYYNYHIDMTAGAWNNYNINISQVAKLVGITGINTIEIEQINLLGGLANKIYWKYVALYSNNLSINKINHFLSIYNVSYIIDNNVQNFWISALERANILVGVYVTKAWIIYKVELPNIFKESSNLSYPRDRSLLDLREVLLSERERSQSYH